MQRARSLQRAGRRGRRPLRGLHQRNAPVFRNVRVVEDADLYGGLHQRNAPVLCNVRVVEDADPYGGLHQCNAPVLCNVRVVEDADPYGGMRIAERSRRVVGDACGFSPALYMEKRFFTMVLPIASACGIISP